MSSDLHLKEQLSLIHSHPVFQLEMQGICIEEGTDSGADSKFLMELMEINEALDEAQTPEEANKIGHDTKGKQQCLAGQFELIVDHKWAQVEE